MLAKIIARIAKQIAMTSCFLICSLKKNLPTINATIIDMHDQIKFVTPKFSNEYTLYNNTPTVQYANIPNTISPIHLLFVHI